VRNTPTPQAATHESLIAEGYEPVSWATDIGHQDMLMRVASSPDGLENTVSMVELGGETTELAIELLGAEAPGWLGAGNFIFSSIGFACDTVKFGAYEVETWRARLAVNSNPALTPAEKTHALAMVERAQLLNEVSYMIKTVGFVTQTAAFVLGVTCPALFLFGVGMFLLGKWMDCMVEDAMGDMLDEILGLSSGKGRIRMGWRIDPSGEIRDTLTDRLLPGVKVTAYFKKTTDDPPEMWDASEYDQANPLYTNSHGFYAWDVPEGLWQVKAELAGYETTTSAWLPVPPPQTDVNLRMVPKSYSLAYVLDGGSNPESAPATYTVGSGTLLPVPTLADHTFLGWYANAEFAGEPIESIPLEMWGDLKLYAKWTDWDATSVSLTKPSVVPAYNGSVALKCQLKTGPSALGDRVIVFERRVGSSWSVVGTALTDAQGHAYKTANGLIATTMFRARFASAGGYLGSSAQVSVTPMVSLSSAKAKRLGSRRYRIYGTVRPAHKATRAVRLYRWRRTVTGKWKSYGYVNCPASSYTYSLKHRFPSKGKWRLQVVHVADASNALTKSGYTVITVK